MLKKCFLSLGVVLFVFSDSGVRVSAQEGEPHIRVTVDLVQLNVAVTDKKGNYVTGLRPQDFAIVEDGIPQKLATFAEGNESARRVLDLTADSKPADPPADAPREAAPPSTSESSLGALVAGANVFILFDTSNYMYRGFVFAQDAISDFVRSLETANKIAFYSYSRDLFRASPLTSDRSQILRAVRTTVAGDDAALYNTLLLTLKDAAQSTARKVVFLFWNGPYHSSLFLPYVLAD